MKLLLCPDCHDMHALSRTKRHCVCGRSWGRYTDDIMAEVGGSGLVVGLLNGGADAAIEAREIEPGDQYTLACFIFPEGHRHVRRVG